MGRLSETANVMIIDATHSNRQETKDSIFGMDGTPCQHNRALFQRLQPPCARPLHTYSRYPSAPYPARRYQFPPPLQSQLTLLSLWQSWPPSRRICRSSNRVFGFIRCRAFSASLALHRSIRVFAPLLPAPHEQLDLRIAGQLQSERLDRGPAAGLSAGHGGLVALDPALAEQLP